MSAFHPLQTLSGCLSKRSQLGLAASRVFWTVGAIRMKKWAVRLLTYPVLLILALIFIGPTIPIDISILIITSIVAAIGLSTENSALSVRPYLAIWRSKVLSMLKG